MAVPTVGSVSPVLLATGGDQILSVTGTGFRVRAPSNVTPAPTLPPTVRVVIGGVPARRVDVLSDTRIDVLVPNHAPGLVHLEVTNLDDSGTAIPGEVVLAPNAATYELQRYTAEYESDLQRLTRQLIRMLREQMLVESNVAIDVDFDQATEDGMNIVKLSTMPGIAIIGPDTRDKRPDHANVPQDVVVNTDGDFVETRPARFVDVVFELIAASNSRMELLNIQTELIAFVQRNPRFCIARSPTAPELGEVCFEFDFDGKDGLPDTGGQPNASNVRQFSARIAIRDVPLLDSGDTRTGTEGGVPKRSIIRHGRAVADAVSMQTTKKE